MGKGYLPILLGAVIAGVSIVVGVKVSK